MQSDKTQQIQKQSSILKDIYQQKDAAKEQLKDLIQQQSKIIQILEKANQEIEDNGQREKQKVRKEVEQYKLNVDRAAALYVDNIQSLYCEAEEKYKNNILKLKTEQNKVLEGLDQVKSSLAAAAAAKLREQEKKQKLNFYKLSLSPQDEEDIKLLQDIKIRFHNPLVISKLIWTTYYQKQTTELCNRILGTEKVCGIYKITDLITDQVYIGQSLDIDRRLKEHIKAGLGIDTTATNLLYKAMLKDKVQNFTFQLMEACPKEQLNSKEAYWIDMFSSDKYGLNAQGGNKK